MSEEAGYLRKLTYTCIFEKSPSKAAENLYRLISGKQCGFDEGSNKWIEVLESNLSMPLDIEDLNIFQESPHDEPWWHEVLSGLLGKLKSIENA